MAYYDALIAQWPSLTPGTTAAKLTQLNAQTVSGQIPTTLFITGDQLFNCISYAEFKVLTATQQNNILAVCRTPGKLLGGSSSTAFLMVGMILDYFPVAGATVAMLTTLAKGSSTPWWQANGYSAPITQADLTAAGALA